MDAKEELFPLKRTVRMHVPGESFNRVIDFYRVATPSETISGKVEVSYRIVVLSNRPVVANRSSRAAATSLYYEFIDTWLAGGGRDAKEGLPDGQLAGQSQ